MKRVRALVIAEAANPEWTSVPLEGWSHSQAVARVADAHLVTQVRNCEAIVRAGLVEGRDFTAIDSEKVAARVHRLATALRGHEGKAWTVTTALGAVSYAYFERLVWERFGARLRAGEFDVVHRITPLSPTTPSFLARKCARAGVPFVMGPLNGGVPWPRGFDSARRREREWLSYVRGLYRLMPGYGSTRRNARAIIIGSRDTWGQMPARFRGKCVYIPENAVDPARFNACVEGEAGTPLRVAFVGRLVPYKGCDMLFEAAAELARGGRVAIDVIGDGPEMERLRGIVARERMEDAVTFAGWVEHTELQGRLAQADVFGFPSVREFGGAVALEAMALGLVPIVMDYGGPGELVTRETGFAIPMGRREEIIARVRATLERLAAAPETVRPMGERARRRVMTSFTWDAKARQTLEVYRWAMGERGAKPDFGMPLPDERSVAEGAEAEVSRGMACAPAGAAGRSADGATG